MGLFKAAFEKIKQGLTRTRQGFVGSLRTILTGKQLSAELLDELEARMIQSDIGVRTSMELVADLRAAWERSEIETGDDALEYLKNQLSAYWPQEDRQLHFAEPGTPTVILVAGVNGAGKTTSIAKIAKSLRDEGRSVMLAACDTFRAAAVEQLEIWSKRLGVDVIKGKQGGAPAAVAFDACDAALARGVDVLIVDTAGRLHTQEHLMRELTKIRDVVARKIAGAPHEVMLVLDATTGQNAIRQAQMFGQAINVTGLFVAKLDGSAKGGFILSIREQLKLPVKFIGLGETPEDIETFDPQRFVGALFQEQAPAVA